MSMLTAAAELFPVVAAHADRVRAEPYVARRFRPPASRMAASVGVAPRVGRAASGGAAQDRGLHRGTRAVGRRVSAIYGRHHRRQQGRDADAPQSDHECGAVPRLSPATHISGTDTCPDRLAALSHLRLHGEFPRLLYAVWAQCADPESAPPHQSAGKPSTSETITFITGVNTLFNGLLNEPWFRDRRRASLRIGVAGGMACRRRSPSAGRASPVGPLTEGYGLTETSPVADLQSVRHAASSAPSACRFPRPSEMRRRASSTRFRSGQPGELAVPRAAGHGRLLASAGRDGARSCATAGS